MRIKLKGGFVLKGLNKYIFTANAKVQEGFNEILAEGEAI